MTAEPASGALYGNERSIHQDATARAVREVFLTPETPRAGRIVVVIASLGGGGAERVVVDLCRYLRLQDRDVTLLTLSGDSPDAYPLPDGVHRERMETRHQATSLFEKMRLVAADLIAMRRRLLALKPDVVVSFIDQTNVRAVLGLLGTGVPVIVSERLHPGYNPLGRMWRMAVRLSYPRAAAVTVQTEQGAQWLRRFTQVRNAVVISNATRYDLDLPAASTPLAPRPLLLAIGRLARQKGFDLLLSAFRQSGLGDSGWRLAILGEGTERDGLEKQAAELGMSEALILPGHVKDIPGWLRQADLFVLSSRYEGFPNVLLEAMQIGLPSISFDCPSGPRELIEHDVNGCLVAAEDVAGLAAEMRRLGHDGELRARLGAAAAKVDERHSPERIYGRWLHLIDAVAAGGFKPHGAHAGDEFGLGRREVGS